MKKSKLFIGAAFLASALTLGQLTAAVAVEPQTSVSSTITSVPKKDKAAINAFKAAKADYLVALEAFKASKESFKAQKAAYKLLIAELKPTLKAYSAAKKVIGQTFATAVSAAKTTYQNAILLDASVEAKLAAKTIFKQAKITAAANRADAIAALGAKPIKPAAPVKPVKPVKPTKPAAE
jgi:hypothetical protein